MPYYGRASGRNSSPLSWPPVARPSQPIARAWPIANTADVTVPLISDPRRGCFMGLSMFIFLFFFFSRHDFVRPISLEPLLAKTPNWVCCLVLRSSFALLLTIQFASLFKKKKNFFFFFAKILSGSYLWNRYSQRLQIECAAWFCGLVLHYCLPSNSLRNFFFLFFRHNFVRAISLEPLLTETPNWVCCLVLRSSFALLLTIQFTS